MQKVPRQKTLTHERQTLMQLVQAFESNRVTKQNMLPDYREWIKKFLTEFLSGKKVSILETKGDFYIVECAESFYLCSKKSLSLLV